MFDRAVNAWSTNPFTSLASNRYRGRWFVYDSLSRLTDAYNPETGHTNWTYDSNSNVATKTDAAGRTITYASDAENRVTGKTYSAGDHAVTYTYDTGAAASNLIHERASMTDASGNTSWTTMEGLQRLATLPSTEQTTTRTIRKIASQLLPE